MARPASDIASRIVRAARTHFLERGVDGASLRQIASDAGTTIGMIYYYFKTKDEVFLAVLEEVYAKVLADLELILASDTDVQTRIDQIYLRFARMSEDEAQTLMLVMREALVSSERLQRLAARFQAGHLPLVAAMIGSGMQTGSLRQDLHPLALMAATFLLGVVSQIALRRVRASSLPIAAALPPPEDAARMLLSVLLHGIAR
jgi:AcrR family transcriptional regulator